MIYCRALTCAPLFFQHEIVPSELVDRIASLKYAPFYFCLLISTVYAESYFDLFGDSVH